MGLMRKQTSGNRPTSAISWPTLLMPPPIEKHGLAGMTEEQIASLSEWYLGVQNSVNSQFADVFAKIEALSAKLDAK